MSSSSSSSVTCRKKTNEQPDKQPVRQTSRKAPQRRQEKPNLHTNIQTPHQIPLRQLQQSLPHKGPTSIEHRRRAFISKLLLDLPERALHRLRIRHVRADADRPPSRLVDLRHQRFVRFRRAGEKRDRVGLGEAPRDGGAGSGAYACYHCEGGWWHSVSLLLGCWVAGLLALGGSRRGGRVRFLSSFGFGGGS